MNKYPDPELDEEEYNESEDDDYSPDKPGTTAKPNNSDGSDDSEDEAELKKLDATYAEFQGRGGLIKTRAQRRAEAAGLIKPEETPKPSAVVGESSVDIDALWQEMNAPSKSSKQNTPSKELPSSTVQETDLGKGRSNSLPESQKPQNSSKLDSTQTSDRKTNENILKDEYITITRTYKFAGDVRTETKEVLKHSAEGQDFLKQEKLKQELKSQGRAPVKRKMSLMEEYQMNKTKKINTLEKSRLDWLGFVDKEGIKEDLTKYNKAGYLDRQEFLSRVDTKREAELRQERAKRMQQ